MFIHLRATHDPPFCASEDIVPIDEWEEEDEAEPEIGDGGGGGGMSYRTVPGVHGHYLLPRRSCLNLGMP